MIGEVGCSAIEEVTAGSAMFSLVNGDCMAQSGVRCHRLLCSARRSSDGLDVTTWLRDRVIVEGTPAASDIREKLRGEGAVRVLRGRLEGGSGWRHSRWHDGERSSSQGGKASVVVVMAW